MTEHDVDNLDFLRSLSDEGLLEWYSQASDEDIQYASEILAEWETNLLRMEAEALGFIVMDIPTTTLQ